MAVAAGEVVPRNGILHDRGRSRRRGRGRSRRQWRFGGTTRLSQRTAQSGFPYPVRHSRLNRWCLREVSVGGSRCERGSHETAGSVMAAGGRRRVERGGRKRGRSAPSRVRLCEGTGRLDQTWLRITTAVDFALPGGWLSKVHLGSVKSCNLRLTCTMRRD